MKRDILPCTLGLALVGIMAALPAPGQAQSIRMNLFASSTPLPEGVTTGGAAADDHCNLLGYAAGAGDVTWGAWLAVPSGSGAALHPRERVGAGPWFNYRGAQVAESTAQLVAGSPELTAGTALTDKGSPVDALPGEALARGTPLPDRRVLCVALQIP